MAVGSSVVKDQLCGIGIECFEIAAGEILIVADLHLITDFTAVIFEICIEIKSDFDVRDVIAVGGYRRTRDACGFSAAA